MRPTRPTLLVALAAAAAVAAYLLVRLAYAALPALPRSWPVTLAALAVIEIAVARNVRARLAGRPRTTPIEPLVVARCAALARASSAAGALLAGGYVGAGAVLLRSLEKSAYARDARTCLLGLLAAVALVAAALWLERACRVRRPPAGRTGHGPTDDSQLGSPA